MPLKAASEIVSRRGLSPARLSAGHECAAHEGRRHTKTYDTLAAAACTTSALSKASRGRKASTPQIAATTGYKPTLNVKVSIVTVPVTWETTSMHRLNAPPLSRSRVVWLRVMLDGTTETGT